MHDYAFPRLADPMLEGQSWSSQWMLGCSFLYLQGDFAARLSMLLVLMRGPAASNAIWDVGEASSWMVAYGSMKSRVMLTAHASQQHHCLKQQRKH